MYADGPAGLLNDVWKSTDLAVSWQPVTMAASWSPRMSHSCTAIGQVMYLLGGGGGKNF